MKPDEFEQQLRHHPLRPVPPAWREEILREAAAAVATPLHGHERQVFAAPAAPPWWQEWLWPCPQAWAGLAAVWILLLGMQVTVPTKTSSLTVQTPPPTPEARIALAAQRREMTRLLEGPEPASAPLPAAPGPRSERFSPSKA